MNAGTPRSRRAHDRDLPGCLLAVACAFVVAGALLGLAPGCAALSSALPVITVIAATIDRIGAEVERMDRVVQATFDIYPEISTLEKGEWLEVLDAVQTARVAVIRTAGAAASLDDGDLQKALVEFQVALEAAQDWMRRHKMLDAEGRYVVAGKIIGEAPAASSFRAE